MPQDDGILDDLALTLVTDYPAMLFCIWFGMQDKLCEGGRRYSINTKKTEDANASFYRPSRSFPSSQCTPMHYGLRAHIFEGGVFHGQNPS